ncbi:MAG: hypothetical protein HS116_15610 [Planctomycetes bacterium]|nr:hypothetical protein [Planctomycetota bacterium]
MPDAQEDTPWFVIEKTYEVLLQGLVLVGGPETSPDFTARQRDIVEIVKPDGKARKTCILDIYPSQQRVGGDLVVDGLKSADVPPGSKLRVYQRLKIKPPREERKRRTDDDNE